MAEKIVIAELDINTEGLIAAAGATKKEIDSLREANKQLKKSTLDTSKEQAKNEIQLKKLSARYLEQKKAVIDLESPYKKLSREHRVLRDRAKDLAVEFGASSKQARAAATEANKLDAQLKKVDKSVGQSQRNVGNYGGALKGLVTRFVSVTAVIYGAIRAFGDMFRRVREFDRAMVGLSAILGTSRSELKDLEEVIKDVAGSSIKTSNEVAELATTLVTLGKTKEEIKTLLKPVNDLSIGLEATSQEAGELLIQTLNAFGKGSESASQYADIIAKMRTSTALDFQRIKDSLGFLAPTARAAGVSFEETGAILGVLVDNGIKAARAGRLTSTSFLKLAADGKTLEDALNEINIAQSEGASETELLAKASNLFGKEAAGLGIILSNNRDRVAELTSEFENSKGSLNELTETQLQSLDARLKILDSTWEKFILNVENGDGAISSFFKTLVDGTASMINQLDDVNTISNSFVDFIGNMARSANVFGSAAVSNEAFIERVRKKTEQTKTQLLDLLEQEAKAKGDAFNRDNEALRLSNSNADAWQKEIDLINERKKAKEDEIAAAEAAKITDEAKKAQAIKLAAEKAEKDRKKREEKEKQDLVTFEKSKQRIKDEIELAQAETDDEKDKIKAEQKKEKQLLELEELVISEEQKNELEQLIEQQHQDALNIIKENAQLREEDNQKKTEQKLAKLRAKFSKEELKSVKLLEDAKNSVKQAALGVFKSILGDSFIARVLDVALQGKEAISRVRIETAASKARNLAQATSALPPPANIPLIAAARVQNGILTANSKIAQGKILLSSLINAAGAAFYEGGQVPQGTGGVISGKNIPTQRGGDNILATVKSGEVILNEQQQARAGGANFFRSIGVPGFQSGGIAGINTSSTPTSVQPPINIDEFTDAITSKINDIKIVAIEQDITVAQQQQVEIVNGANI